MEKYQEIKQYLENIAQNYPGNALFSPVELEVSIEQFSVPLEAYSTRLAKIGFNGKQHILDAGCGPGQWCIAAAKSNNMVTGIDVSKGYIEIAKMVTAQLNMSNIDYHVSSIEELAFPQDNFDAIFCYGVLMFTNIDKVIKEFYRVLKPGGSVYILASGFGWYLNYIFRTGIFRMDFKNARLGIGVIRNTLKYGKDPEAANNKFFYIPSDHLINKLSEQGFTNIDTDIDIKDKHSISRYLGFEAVYEIVCQKP